MLYIEVMYHFNEQVDFKISSKLIQASKGGDLGGFIALLHKKVMRMDVNPYLYGFVVDSAREEADLVNILYLHKKMRFLNSHCTGYECFKDT